MPADTATSTASPTGTPPATCPQFDLGTVRSATVTGTTAGGSDLVGGSSCGDGSGDGTGAPDATYQFTAPIDATYTIGIDQASFDTILSVRAGTCAGVELDCTTRNRDEPWVRIDMAAGNSVVIALDGFGGDSGTFTLSVQGPPTPTPTRTPTPVPGDCCTDNAVANCNDAACAACVCAWDPYCCSTRWDGLCAIEATDACAPSCSCALGTPVPTLTPVPTDTPPPTFTPSLTAAPSVTATPSPTLTPTVVDSCPLFDLGQTLPVSVTGSTATVSNAMGGASCGDGGANAADVTYQWTAPADGAYAIGTLGSAFNTILSVRDGGCTGTELACNDDSNNTLQSQVIVTLAMGQTVVIVIDGYGGAAGDYQLSITQAEDCCTANASAACASAACAACVCTLDPYCCTTRWDGLCAGEALDPCWSACGCPTPIPTATTPPTPTPTPPATPTTTPAGLVIETPADGSFVNSTPIQVSGQAPGADTVTVNDVPASLVEGTFTASVGLV